MEHARRRLAIALRASSTASSEQRAATSSAVWSSSGCGRSRKSKKVKRSTLHAEQVEGGAHRRPSASRAEHVESGACPMSNSKRRGARRWRVARQPRESERAIKGPVLGSGRSGLSVAHSPPKGPFGRALT